MGVCGKIEPMSPYALRPLPPSSVRDELSSFDDLTQRLLFARDIETKKDADIFFSHAYEEGLHDPFLLPDMEKAVVRILRALSENEHIAIYSDYDCDGIPGGVLMHDFFTGIGYTNFENYIPHRHEEGYGLNVHAIDALNKKGTTLMITVDCGITDNAEVAHAQTLGIDVIVTDHHEPSELLPPAVAVVNPKRTDSVYPFSGLCGTGVAFKLVTALISRLSTNGSIVWPLGKEKWLLDLVGLATIADMMPLRGENRLLAHYGLLVMRKGRRLGLQHLFREMRMDARTVSEGDIGFMIAPRINAASRMGTPEDAFRLLATTESAEAGELARHLERINNERKGVVASMVKSVKHKLAQRSSLDSVLVVGDASWRPALVGLAANALAEEYVRPAFVWGRDGRHILKGSCRSGGSVSVIELMRGAEDMFLEYGGHHASGGFAVREEHIHTFPARLNSVFAALQSGEERAHPTAHQVDAALSLEDVGPELVRTLERFTPFGEANEKPLFLFRKVTPLGVHIFGKQKNHTKLSFVTSEGAIGAIGFFKKPDEFSVTLEAKKSYDMLAHVEESSFGGRREIRLRVVDVYAPH